MVDDLRIYRRHLPHWRLAGAVYFVTWRLHAGQPVLSPDERSSVVRALRHFEGARYRLLAFVVMDDHVHALVQPLEGAALEQLLHSWKSFTASDLRRRHSRSGAVWQAEYFDRIVRDQAELAEKTQYILNNPLKRWPDARDYPWVGIEGQDGDG